MDKVYRLEENGPLKTALLVLARELRDARRAWLIGGSTGLLLQGTPLAQEPRDIDLYADREDATVLHRLLHAYSIDVQEENASGMYRSLLSHYEIAGKRIELVGAFHVSSGESRYVTEAAYLAEHWAEKVQLCNSQGQEQVRLMPLAHELIFNVLRGREDRYEAAAAQMKQHAPQHLSAVRAILARNHLCHDLAGKIAGLLGCPLHKLLPSTSSLS